MTLQSWKNTWTLSQYSHYVNNLKLITPSDKFCFENWISEQKIFNFKNIQLIVLDLASFALS